MDVKIKKTGVFITWEALQKEIARKKEYQTGVNEKNSDAICHYEGQIDLLSGLLEKKEYAERL